MLLCCPKASRSASAVRMSVAGPSASDMACWWMRKPEVDMSRSIPWIGTRQHCRSMTACSPRSVFSVLNTDIPWANPRGLSSGRRSSGILPTAHRRSLIFISQAVSQSGSGPPVLSSCCRTDMRGWDPSTPVHGLNVFFNSVQTTTCRCATPPRRHSIFTCFGSRSNAIFESPW